MLEPMMGPSIPWDGVRLHIGRVPGGSLPAPRALVPRSCAAVTAKEPERSLRTVGMTLHRDVYLEKHYANFTTASGLALLAHELKHVEQFEADPKFAQRYDAAARNTPVSQPWTNPYEEIAYQEERRIYCQLVAQGVPKGRWTPLGVMLWGC